MRNRIVSLILYSRRQNSNIYNNTVLKKTIYQHKITLNRDLYNQVNYVSQVNNFRHRGFIKFMIHWSSLQGQIADIVQKNKN